MVKKETKLCIIKTIINSISNIIIAVFRRKKNEIPYSPPPDLPTNIVRRQIGRRAAATLPTSLNAATAICSPYSRPSSP